MEILIILTICLLLTGGFFYLPFLLDNKYLKEKKGYLYFFLIVANLLYFVLFYIFSQFFGYNIYVFIFQILCLILIYYGIIYKLKTKKLIFLMIFIFGLSSLLYNLGERSHWEDYSTQATLTYDYDCIGIEFKGLFEKTCIGKVIEK